MTIALAIAIGSVVFGTLLALSRTATALTGIQTFAVVSALGVVLVHLLPEALAGVGLVALVVFALSLVFAAGLDRWAHVSSNRALGLELGFVGLCLHKVADGIALGHFASPIWPGVGPVAPSFDVLFAVAAHAVPVTVMVVLAFLPRGMKHALMRAGILATCAVVGVLLVNLVPTDALMAAHPWVSAATAGLLLHVVMHGWTAAMPTGWAARLTDFGAAAAGVTLVVLGQGHPGVGGINLAESVRADTGAALLELSLETAPVLLIGLTLAAILQTFGRHIPDRWLRGGSSFRLAGKGVLLGLPLPICACGILPVAQSLKQRKAAPALVVALLLATPELGIETFALSVKFLGWTFAWTRLLAAMAVSLVAALLVSSLLKKRQTIAPEIGPVVDTGPEGSRLKFFFAQLDEVLRHTLPWTAVGLLAAAYLQAVLPSDAFEGWGVFADFLVVTMVAVPSYVCATSATPLAAVLIGKGLSPGAVLVGLLLGPATNLATVGWLRAAYGARAALGAIAGLVVVAWGVGVGLNALDPTVPVAYHSHAHAHGWWANVGLALLCLLAGAGVWFSGLRGWLAALGGHHGHGHGHGGHGHGGHGHGGHGHGGHGHGGHGHAH